MSEEKNYVKRTQRDYSISLNLQIVQEIVRGELSTHGACKKIRYTGPFNSCKLVQKIW